VHSLEIIILENEAFSTKYIFSQKLSFITEMRKLVVATAAFSFFNVVQQTQSWLL